jgi:hypothetical protein
MGAVVSHPSVKVIGANGQVSLGKRFAGRQVLVEEQEPGVWLVRTATVMPDNERWLHQPDAAADLKSALTWAQENPPDDTNLIEALEQLRG